MLLLLHSSSIESLTELQAEEKNKKLGLRQRKVTRGKLPFWFVLSVDL